MRGGRKLAWIGGTAAVAAALLAAVLAHTFQPYTTVHGAVVRDDPDFRKQLPISGAQISAPNSATAQSDSTGMFQLRLRDARPGQPVALTIRHAGYQPLSMSLSRADILCIARMVPIPAPAPPESSSATVTVANISIRYTQRTAGYNNVGSAVKPFEIVNKGNIPCHGQPPCSPDGKWKAAIGPASLDAGEGNEFRNARLSCIAGPCPFTRVVSDQFSHGGRYISVSVLDWSDPVTFLLEAEVFQRMAGDVVRTSYPVMFGNTLNFSLPHDAEGASILAELNGQPIVFPLPPNLKLGWANCTARDQPGTAKVYRCELKSGFLFQAPAS